MKALHFSILLHRWAGLALAVFVILVSITGGALVFRPELDRWLNPDLFVTSEGASSLPVSAIVQRALDRHADMRPSQVIFPDAVSRSWRVLLESRPGAAAPGTEVFVDPFTGELLGSRLLKGGNLDRRTLVYYVRRFHYNMLLGTVMYRVVGVLALVWLIVTAFGVYVAWPRRGSWRRVFSVKFSMGALRALFDAHRSAGMLSVLVLLPMLITGLWWNMDYLTRPMVHAALPTTDWLQGVLSHSHHTASAERFVAVSPILDAVVETACGSDGKDACARLLFDHHQGQYQLWFGQRAALKAEWLAPDMNGGGAAIRTYSMTDGVKINSIETGNAKAGDLYAALQYPLHTGAFFGMPGRVLWFVASLVPVLLAISGFYVWLKRRPQAAARRRA